ncbi:FAD-binding oxidoreductase [Endozoicomonas sp. SCSIO W0465]|uniref:FAD-binding oxidoreductase n=1 Tax=Endozoicomonas sp. SCSIO W0465 TaxID=2918516 RepID=UPI002075C77C|nr:FAD-binding oxidoreductase [Endozoicomonas sp. SCSIO W0465]USE34907.1 FAD-binding oxidoreductase [Endozoicomonas sp. SCSIO W0465]
MQEARAILSTGLTLFLLILTGKLFANEFPDSLVYETVSIHTDAGGINTCNNINEFFPESRQQLVKLVKHAKQSGKKIILTGAKHSMAGQVTCHKGDQDKQYLLLSLEKMPVKSSLDGQYLTVSAQVTWDELINILKQDNSGPALAPGVMQDFSVFTIGGSMSANAMGRDPRFGPMIDSIKSFTLLKADGEVMECSRTHNSRCFEAVIGGHGAFGVILEATILLVPDVAIQLRNYQHSNSEYAVYLKTQVSQSKELDKHYGLLEFGTGELLVNIHEYYEVADKGQPLQPSRANKTKNSAVADQTTRREYLHHHRFSFKWGGPNQSSQLLSVAVPLHHYEEFSEAIPDLVTGSSGLKFHEITTKYIQNQQAKNMLQLITQDSIVFVFVIENRKAIQSDLDLFKKRLYRLTQSVGGKPYLAFDLPKDTDWLIDAYPRAKEWLALKQEFDPNMTFYSQFFHNFKRQISPGG